MKKEKNIVDWGGIYRPIMKEKRINAAELCRNTGIPKSTMSRILNTSNEISGTNRMKIENYLKITL